MPHAIIRGENGRRHKVNFGDAAVRVGIHPRDRRDLHRGGFRDDPRRASALRPSEHSPPPVQRSPCRGGTTCHKYSYYILDVVRNSDISAELAPASSREEKPFKVRWPSRLGEPVPSIGYIGRMTILHPVAGWLAIAAEAVSAMMAATRRTRGGLRHAQGLGTPKLIQPPESHVANRGVGAAAPANSGWRRFRPQRYARISGNESARTGAGDRRRRHRRLGVAHDPAWTMRSPSWSAPRSAGTKRKCTASAPESC